MLSEISPEKNYGPAGIRAIMTAIIGSKTLPTFDNVLKAEEIKEETKEGDISSLPIVPTIDTGMNGEPYSAMKSIRLWKCKAGDDGALAAALLLKTCTPEKLQLQYLEMVDTDIGVLGCKYLGQALGNRGNASLLALNLNYNSKIGDEGCYYLYNSLQCNITLKVSC